MKSSLQKGLNSTVSRREFFKWGAFAGFAALAVGVISKVQPAYAVEEGRKKKGDTAAAGADVMCDPKSGMAKSMNYSLKHSDVKDAKLKTTKNNLKFEEQFCHNCSFYAKKSTKAGKEIGSCQVLNSCSVEGTAWCTSWNKKS